MAKILKGFDQKSKEALSRALTEELGLQTVLNWEALLAKESWPQAQSQDPLEQLGKPLVFVPNLKQP